MVDNIRLAIQKYEKNELSEQEFHSIIESIIPMITEDALHEVRSFLTSIEGELELIDFTINQEDRSEEYLNVIQRIKEYPFPK
jgi:signal transduction histidine kinase